MPKHDRVQTLPPEIQAIVDHYMQLSIGGKHVAAPYFINQKGRKARRVAVGKGTPIALERETARLAKKYHFDLAAASTEQIREFMRQHNLGIDCSGLVAWSLHALHKARTKRALWQNLRFPMSPFRAFIIRRLRPVENISAHLLTNVDNSDTIHDLQKVRPGDLIRTLNGRHVILVTEVIYDKRGVTQIKYINSTEGGNQKLGMLSGVIVMKKPSGHLLEQEWVGAEWVYQDARKFRDDTRVVRLKALAKLP